MTGATGGSTYGGAATARTSSSLPFPGMRWTPRWQFGDLHGTVVVDVSYPYRKAARYLTAPEVDGIAASVLIAGDDPEAKEVVFELARDMGFDPVDVGP